MMLEKISCKENINIKQISQLSVSSAHHAKPHYEVNGLSYNKKTGILYAATGDSIAYSWDLNTHQLTNSFRGHTNYLHCIKSIDESRIATGSEDGTVRIWDARSGKSSLILDCGRCTSFVPESFTSTNSNYQTYVTCLDTDETGNWLVCGSGYNVLSMWYLPMRSLSCCMPSQGTPQTVIFNNGQIVSAGNEPKLYVWDQEGKLKTRVQTSSKSIFSIASDSEHGSKGICGSSPNIEMFNEFFHKTISLNVVY
eukprot:TRINITY_DN3590_c0_g1_i2.p1 TRINITY_DN3590_c0_g1~~TRINITY_DN3590_c0_g1_i2.p1  ORF type:complete len:253 (+),score=32.19 TRINITY_DN3590_c0_g1_i2:424-1182(+)